MYRIIALVLSMSALARSLSAQSPEERFWTWFVKSEPALYAVQSADEPICDSLATELRRVRGALTFEFGPVDRGRREFVISADGIREAFPAVLALVKAAPRMPRWTIIPFRPARPDHFTLRLGNVSVDTKNVLFVAEAEGELTHLTLAIPGFRPTADKVYEQAAYLLLDTMLGEYAVETAVGAIDVIASEGRPPGAWRPLIELPQVVKVTPPPAQ